MGESTRDAHVQRLLDRLEIQDLVTRYYNSTDRRDFDGFRSCFIPGTMVDYSEVLAVAAETPIEEVAALIEATMAETFGPTQHFMGNHAVTIDGDRGTGTTYCLAIHQFLDPNREAGQRLVSALRYVDRYLRTELGWRIEHRLVTRDIGFFFTGRQAQRPPIPAAHGA
jgi:hypothetical protein